MTADQPGAAIVIDKMNAVALRTRIIAADPSSSRSRYGNDTSDPMFQKVPGGLKGPSIRAGLSATHGSARSPREAPSRENDASARLSDRRARAAIPKVAALAAPRLIAPRNKLTLADVPRKPNVLLLGMSGFRASRTDGPRM